MSPSVSVARRHADGGHDASAGLLVMVRMCGVQGACQSKIFPSHLHYSLLHSEASEEALSMCIHQAYDSQLWKLETADCQQQK